MSYRIELHPEAVRELSDTFQWYEERLEGLGSRFLSMVDKRLSEIGDHPERYAKKKRNYRETTTDGFPYVIIYEVIKKQKLVYIYYIFHPKRNPRLKYKR